MARRGRSRDRSLLARLAGARIGGVRLADGSEDYGISEAALALLYTLDRDNSAEAPVAELLIPHGCGLILMAGCGIGINWSVAHEPDFVLLDDVVVHPNLDLSERHPEARVRVPLPRYRGQVLDFAAEVHSFFNQAQRKQFRDKLVEEQYSWFWSQFDEAFARHTELAEGGVDDR